MQDAQSQRFLPVENSPVPLCSISMGGKGGGYTYIIRELPQSKPVGFASSLWEGAFGMGVQFLAQAESVCPGITPSVIACGDATFPKGTAFGGGDKVSGSV